MKNLIKAIETEQKARLAEFIKDINKIKNTEDLNKWQYNDLLPRGKKLTGTIKENIAYIILRKEKQIYARIEQDVNHIKTVFGAGKLISIRIQLEWVKSRMYGYNPVGEAWVVLEDKDGNRDSKYFKCSGISGCGYDKASTALARLLNQCNEALKPLYIKKNKNIDKANGGLLGYGSGYGIVPSFEGGVGVSCYPRIFEGIGYKFETTASGKTFDAFKVTMN